MSVDLLATLKGVFATLCTAAVLVAFALPIAWALVIGATVIAVEKRNHGKGRRDGPVGVAFAMGLVVAVAVATFYVVAA